MSGAERALRVEGELMPRRLWVLGLGLGLVMTMLGAGSASAAPKKRPDLVVAAVSVTPGKVVAGGVLKVGDTTRNKGRKKAKRSVTRYALSANKKWDKKDVVLGSRAVKVLKPGKKHAVKARSVRVAAATRPGTYWLLACADAKKKVRESNERNNCRVAKRRVTVTKKAFSWPKVGMVKVNVSAVVDVRLRSHSHSTDGLWDTKRNSDVRLNGKGSGWLLLEGGKPESLTWQWSGATAAGTATLHAVGEAFPGCPWTASGKLTRSATVPTTMNGVPEGGSVTFPASKKKIGVEFHLQHTLGTQAVPRETNCADPMGPMSPPLTLELRPYWWFKDPTYTIGWTNDFSKITWREHGEQHDVAPGGDGQDQSYTADGVLTVTPVT
ncbi:hypothetical protein KV100_02905 [Mumia sp. zg.B21]|uniref:CARDB domain-containing protein n=1 Tax=Mumia sp. zg.B21 TaxID=2855447 RepID=UPI001C6EEE58|nr:CARDB domain-containing protein [Mumia sp. zg.B21]MBW9208589.1 hypothetical protein [Mumia sp. zg.B21]